MKAYFDDEEDFGDALSAAHARGGWRATLSIWAGACLGVVVLGSLGYWGYGLLTRAPDEVPIIRAAATPAKERPDQPGGEQTPHQSVGAFDPASGEIESVTLAAPSPQPGAEDVPMGELEGQQTQSGTGVVTAIVGGVEEIPDDPFENITDERSAQIAAEQALIEESLRQVLAENSATGPVPPIGSGSDQAPPYSPPAIGKPDGMEQRVAQQTITPEDTVQVAAVDPDLQQRAANSQIQVQLGAFAERTKVDSEWDRILGTNRDILAGRALAVQQTVSGGTVYYRLRVGPFRDGHEANTVCQALKARGQDCLVAINTDRRG